MSLELEYRGQRIWATQVWAAAVPEYGTIILGETQEQARETLRQMEGGPGQEHLTSLEIELRLIMLNPNREQRLQLLNDWVRIREHEQRKRDGAN